MAADDVVRQLRSLSEMHAAGILDDQEFALAKARLLDLPASSDSIPPGWTFAYPN